MIRRVRRTCAALLLDENGQTMLDYCVIIVFSVIVTIIFFRLVRGIVHRTTGQMSVSLDTD